MTATTRPTVMTSVFSTSSTEARTVSVRSLSTFTSIPCGSDAWSCGRSAFTRSATWMTFAPGWRWTLRMMARLSLAQPASWAFSTPSTDAGHVRQANRRAVGVRDDERLEAGGLEELVVRRERVVLPRAVDVALGLVDVRRDQRAAHVLQREARRPPSATGSTWTRTAGFWPPLIVTRPTPETCEIFCARIESAIVVDLVERQDVRADRKREDRLVGGVALRVGGRRRQLTSGSRLDAALMAACTSCWAASMLRSRSNCSVICE